MVAIFDGQTAVANIKADRQIVGKVVEAASFFAENLFQIVFVGNVAETPVEKGVFADFFKASEFSNKSVFLGKAAVK